MPGPRLPPKTCKPLFFSATTILSCEPPAVCTGWLLPASPAAASWPSTARTHTRRLFPPSPASVLLFFYYYYYYYFLELCTAAKSNFLPPQPSPRRGSDHTNQVSSATLGTPAVGAGEQLDSSVSSPPHYKLVCKDRRHPRLLRGFLGARLTREVFGPVFVHVLGQIAPSGDESPVEGGGWVLINTSADSACSCLRRENPPSLVPALLKSSPFQASWSCGSPRGVS